MAQIRDANSSAKYACLEFSNAYGLRWHWGRTEPIRECLGFTCDIGVRPLEGQISARNIRTGNLDSKNNYGGFMRLT